MKFNTLINSTLLMSACSACMISTLYAAPTQTIVFGSKGNFYCAGQGSGEVRIDTHHLDARGFCNGQPDVTSAGHVKITLEKLNQNNFAVNSNHGKGYITVDSDSSVTSMKCQNGTLSGRDSYGAGQEYCAIKPFK